MLDSVFGKTIRDLRRPLVLWGVGILTLVAAMAAIWPSIRSMADLEQFLAGYPEAMRAIFNVEAITTGAGFLNAELFSIMLPAMFIIFGIGKGARLIAGEEEAGTIEVLVATPVPRERILMEKAAGLGVAVLVLGSILLVSIVLASATTDLGIGTLDAAGASLGMVLLGIQHGWLALAIGAATGSRARAIGVASAVAGVGYVVYVMAALVDGLSALRPLSPFTQALIEGPLGGGLVPTSYLWLALTAVLVLLAATPVWTRRDIAIA